MADAEGGGEGGALSAAEKRTDAEGGGEGGARGAAETRADAAGGGEGPALPDRGRAVGEDRVGTDPRTGATVHARQATRSTAPHEEQDASPPTARAIHHGGPRTRHGEP
jgi:hypothetical protein